MFRHMKQRMYWLGAVMAVGLLWSASVLAAAKKSEINTKLADGAVAVATSLLSDDKADERGMNLLKFALAVDAEHSGALLLQAKLEREQELPKVDLPDQGKGYIDFLQSLIRKTKSSSRQLLLWKVVELVDPQSDEALLALTKAKNSGTDIGFEALLGVLGGESKLATAEGKPAEEATPAASADKPAAEEGDARPVGRRIDVRPGVDVTVRNPHPNPKEVLAAKTVQGRGYYGYDPSEVLGRINQAVFASGVLLYVNTRERTVGYSGSCWSDGVPYPTSTGNSWPRAYHPCKSWSDDMNTWELFRNMAMLYSLGYYFEPGKAVLTDPDNPLAVKELGMWVEADELAAEFKASRVDSLNKYRNKLVAVRGLGSGIGKDSDRTYVALASDQVRIILDDVACADQITLLKGAYGEFKDDERARKEAERERRYYQSSIYRTHYADYGEIPVFVFLGSGVCQGQTGGRIVFKGCKEFSFMPCWPKNK